MTTLTAPQRDPARASREMASPVVLPFAQYLGIARQAQAADMDAWYASTKPSWDAAEAQAAQCAQAAGFTYFPTGLPKPVSDISTGDTLPIPALPADAAGVAQYGYGLLADTTGDPSAGASQDPNAAYFDSLDADAQQAYGEVMYGETGCLVALGSVGGQPSTDTAWYEDAVTGMMVALYGYKGATEQDIRPGVLAPAGLAALDASWTACMTSTGPLTGADLPAGTGQPGPALAFDAAIRTGADGTRAPADATPDTLPVDQRSLTGSDPAKAIAQADFTCRQQKDYVNKYAAMVAQGEADWVTSNRAVLNTLVSTWEKKH